MTGPSTIAVGTVGAYAVEDHLVPGETTTMTIHVARSLLADDRRRVNVADPIPADWGVELSTNSRTGTTIVNSGTIAATYHGDARNLLLIDVPNRWELSGETFYVQVDFSNGEGTDPIPVMITAD